MDRGVVPPSEDRLAQMQQRFFDPAASDADRLRSLRLLRRGNQQLDDTVVAQAVNWLQSSTNGNTRRELLQQLDGVTNSALKQPLLAMLQTETSRNVREELVDVLSDFANDPAVESKLWDLALNDPDGDVRGEARDALTGGRLTPERIDRLREKAGSPNASLDERLLSLRALREANVQAPELISEMASMAQNATDPITRAKLFQAFDGINDPTLMAPLVHGLQDPNPVVRENAVDALSTFSSDPRIQEWLNHVIQNDTDPRVKREAHSALEESQRRARRGR
jgi:HEAT repeat protein